MRTINGLNFENQILSDFWERDKCFNGAVIFKNTTSQIIYFKNCIFNNTVDFSNIEAKGTVSFIDCTFIGEAIFTEGTFRDGIITTGCIFKNKIFFDWCSFYRYARFWKTNFEDTASFNQSYVLTEEIDSQNAFIFKGELNFSYSYFSSEANFTRMNIQGPAYFWRTIFEGNSNFSETHFRDFAVFEGSSSDICISKLELQDPELFDQLLKEDLLRPDAESREKLYAHFSGVTKWDQFEQLFNKAHFNKKPDALKKLWEKYNRSMFNEKATNSFYLTSFSLPEDVKFCNLSLRGVDTAELALQSVKLENITWHSSRIYIYKKRLSIHNEINKAVPKDYILLSRIYNKLKISYTNIGMYEEARDFHCGELEMKRKIKKSMGAKLINFDTYYKCIGYGEYSEFPFFWLLFTIFCLFPILYMIVHSYQHFIDSLIHTLEITAFLTSPEKNNVNTSNITRILDGILRIILALEVTMFLLPLKKHVDNR